MHTLSEQLHATNMVSFVCAHGMFASVCGVCVSTCVRVCSLSLLRNAVGVLLQMCYG